MDGDKRAVVGPGVGGVVVQRPVMEDGDARLTKDLRHLIPHPHHVAAGVGSAVVAGPDDSFTPGGGVGLAAVGVENQNLGPVLRQMGGKGLLQV